MRKIKIDLLHINLIYEADTGNIFSRTSRGNVKAGSKLGSVQGNGYMTIHLCKVTMFFHRVAFAMHNGFWPEMVDHIDGDITNNRADNLRAADAVINARNAAPKRGARFRGTFKRANGWDVSISAEGKQIWIGKFKSEIEAAFHYDMASLRHHGDHGRRNFLPFVR